MQQLALSKQMYIMHSSVYITKLIKKLLIQTWKMRKKYYTTFCRFDYSFLFDAGENYFKRVIISQGQTLLDYQ